MHLERFGVRLIGCAKQAMRGRLGTQHPELHSGEVERPSMGGRLDRREYAPAAPQNDSSPRASWQALEATSGVGLATVQIDPLPRRKVDVTRRRFFEERRHQNVLSDEIGIIDAPAAYVVGKFEEQRAEHGVPQPTALRCLRPNVGHEAIAELDDSPKRVEKIFVEYPGLGGRQPVTATMRRQ